MEKRVLVAVFLSFLVLFAYQTFVKPPRRPPAPPATSDIEKARPAETTAAAPTQPAVEAAAPPVTPVVSAAAEQDVVVQAGSVRAVFSNRGAVLKSWQLLHYQTGDGQPLEMVAPDAPAGTPSPFSLVLDDAALTAQINSALFRPSATSVDASGAPASIQFDYEDATGLTVRKSYAFDPKRPFEMAVSVTARRGETALNPAIHAGPALGGPDPATQSSSYYQKPQAIYSAEGDVTRVAAASIGKERVRDGAFRFAGVDDHYFITTALPEEKQVRVTYDPLSTARWGSPYPLVGFAVQYPEAPAGARFFIGPKDFDQLYASDDQLVRSIHFGVFGFLAAPLLRALKWLNASVGNYGWSIIILTILINAAMFPLRHKSVVSMRKMQEIQPEVKQIQDRYAKLKATDPARQKMNVELMNLYRERGVNPASGCIPMLLTMPVLFAFYSLLSVAIEIRGAPFIWWIKDLAQHDPLFITPVLMGGTMFWQQKMTPTTADPAQQRIMLFMPIMFTVMFLWASSGLVIYWLVSNLWGIGQQHVTNWIIGPPVVKVVRPPAERRLKKAGAGRTEQAEADAQGFEG